MNLSLTINGVSYPLDCPPHTTLLTAIRSLGFHSVKFGDEHGLSGADTVLLDGKPVNAGLMLAAQAEGHKIATLEALGEHPEQGWRKTGGLHPLQQAFIESGAIQCGYCTPAQILAAQALLAKNPNPTEAEVREALSGVLCRCTGYKKPVEAVMRVVNGNGGMSNGTWKAETEETEPETWDAEPPAPPLPQPQLQTAALPKMVVASEANRWQVVGRPERKWMR